MRFKIKKYGENFIIHNIPEIITKHCCEVIGKTEFAEYISGYVNAAIDMGYEYAKKKYIKIIPVAGLVGFVSGWAGNEKIKAIEKKLEEKNKEN